MLQHFSKPLTWDLEFFFAEHCYKYTEHHDLRLLLFIFGYKILKLLYVDEDTLPVTS